MHFLNGMVACDTSFNLMKKLAILCTCLVLLPALVSCSSPSSDTSGISEEAWDKGYYDYQEDYVPSRQELKDSDCVGRPAGVICWTEADYYVGHVQTAQGQIVNTYDAGNVIFLDFGYEVDDRQWLTIIIWPENRQNFPTGDPAEYYDGKFILVTGLISLYEGRPQIEVSGPEQIQVLDWTSFF